MTLKLKTATLLGALMLVMVGFDQLPHQLLDEDDMVSDSATDAASQQSIKAYSDSATQTMTNKTLTSPVLNTGISGTAFLDEDNMASDSATKLASQQSIKKYVDDNAGGSTQVVVVVDEKTAGTHGGTFTSGAWQTRDLNTLRVNDGTIASLASNQVTLPAGDYECWIAAPAYDVALHMIRLQDITDVSTIVTGMPIFSSSTSNSNNGFSVLYHKFTLSVSSALEVQHRSTATSTNTQGFGIAANIGVVETYTTAMFRQVN